MLNVLSYMLRVRCDPQIAKATAKELGPRRSVRREASGANRWQLGKGYQRTKSMADWAVRPKNLISGNSREGRGRLPKNQVDSRLGREASEANQWQMG